MEDNINQMYANIGKVIKKYRQNLNMTKKELAEGICSSPFITMIENGTRCPNAIILFKLCAKLGVSPDLIYRTLFFSDIEQYLENESNFCSCLRRMDYLNSFYYEKLNKNIMPLIVDRQDLQLMGEIFVESLKTEKFPEQLEKAKKYCPQIDKMFLTEKISNGELPLLKQYDICMISDYVFLHIFAGKSVDVYDKLSKHINVLNDVIITEINIQQLFLILKFEMALICNDLGKYKEGLLIIEDALEASKRYTLSASIPYLMYTKGENYLLSEQKEIGNEYIKKAYELHQVLSPANDKFTIIKLRMKQKGINYVNNSYFF